MLQILGLRTLVSHSFLHLNNRITAHFWSWMVLFAFVTSTNTGLKGDSCKAPFNETEWQKFTLNIPQAQTLSPQRSPPLTNL